MSSTLAFHPLENSDYTTVFVSIRFHRKSYDYFYGNWEGLHDHLRYVP